LLVDRDPDQPKAKHLAGRGAAHWRQLLGSFRNRSSFLIAGQVEMAKWWLAAVSAADISSSMAVSIIRFRIPPTRQHVWVRFAIDAHSSRLTGSFCSPNVLGTESSIPALA
jgi:hypothetical protein